MMMKTFLFLLCLIKGHMGDAADAMTSIEGGSVIITCMNVKEETRKSAKSFCKVSGSECTTITEVNNDLWIPEERFSMTDNATLSYINVFIRNLTINDSGTYRCKAGRTTIQTVNLNVEQDPCCGRSEERTAYLGETAVFHSKYPEKFKDYLKLLYKVQNGSLESIINTFGSSDSSGRFSLNVNEQEHVFTVTITGVSRHDVGVYYCGVKRFNSVYIHLFTEIQLHVSEAPVLSDLYIIITACVCVILLIAAGLSLLLFKRRCKKTEGSVSSDQRNSRDADEVVTSPYYEAIQDSAQESIGLNTVYATANLPTSPSDRDFYTLAEKPQNTKT